MPGKQGFSRGPGRGVCAGCGRGGCGLAGTLRRKGSERPQQQTPSTKPNSRPHQRNPTADLINETPTTKPIYVHQYPRKLFRDFFLLIFLPKTVRKQPARRAGGGQLGNLGSPLTKPINETHQRTPSTNPINETHQRNPINETPSTKPQQRNPIKNT